MHEHVLETREPSCMPKATKAFFIPMVHSPLRDVGHMEASELSSWGGRAQSRETHGSTGALPCGEAGSRAEGHVAAPEPISTGRRGLELRDTWLCQSPPRQGGGVQSHVSRGSAGAHLSKEAGFGATCHMAVPEPTLAGRQGPEL
jgi:hypothetical protein